MVAVNFYLSPSLLPIKTVIKRNISISLKKRGENSAFMSGRVNDSPIHTWKAQPLFCVSGFLVGSQ